MKKGIYAVLAICTIFALVLGAVGCGGDTKPAAKVTVSFDLAGGTYKDQATIKAVKVDKGKKLSADYFKSENLKGPAGSPDFDTWVIKDTTTEVGAQYKFNKNTTLTATWKSAQVAQVKITFDLNVPEGKPAPAAIDPAMINKGSALGTKYPADPASSDVTLIFLGWYTVKEATGGTQVTRTAPTFSEDTTIYARWYALAEDEQAIIFRYNYGSSAADIANEPAAKRVIIKIGASVGDQWPADPVRSGYEFGGWNQLPNGQGNTYTKDSTEFPTATSGGAENNTLWAKWTRVGGAEETPPPGTDLANAEKITTMNAWYPVYRFVLPEGKTWENYSTITADIMVGDQNYEKENFPRNLRLMGNYKNSDFTFVTLTGGDPGKRQAVAAISSTGGPKETNKNAPYIMGDIDTGINYNSYTVSSMLDKLQIINLANQKPGVWEWFTLTYRTDGTNHHNDFDSDNMPKAEDKGPFIFGLGMSAQNEPGTQYIRNVKLKGKSGIPDVVAIPLYYRYTDGNTYPAYVGYSAATGEFGGKEASRALVSGTPELTDYNVTVTFNINGGNPTSLTTTSLSIIKGTAMGDAFPAAPTIDDTTKAFVRWNTKQDNTGEHITSETLIQDDVTLYAIWGDKIAITLDLVWNTDPSDPEDPKIYIGEGGSLSHLQLTELEPECYKTGYRLAGWNTAADGTGDVIDLYYEFNAATTIYAQWIATVNVTFNLNYAGAATIPVVTIDSDVAIGNRLPANPSRTGGFFSFAGWNLDPNGKGVQIKATNKFTRDTTVYAVWKAIAVAGKDLVVLSTDPSLASEAISDTAVGQINQGGSWPVYSTLTWTIPFPAGLNVASYESYTIKAKFYKDNGSGGKGDEYTPADKGSLDAPEGGLPFGLAQIKFTSQTGDYGNVTGYNGQQSNLGTTADGYYVADHIPIPQGFLDNPTAFKGFYIQGAGNNGQFKYIEITDIIFHTGLGGESAAITIDYPTFTDPLFSTINDQVWNLSKGNLTISVPADYTTYAWTVNNVTQDSTTNSLTLSTKDYASKINTKFTVTAIARNATGTYSKSIVVTVQR